MAQVQSIEINLLGQKISLKSQGDFQLTQEVVRMVSSKIREAEKRQTSQAPHHVALLALLSLAEEYLLAKKRSLEHYAQIEKKSEELFSLLETEFASEQDSTEKYYRNQDKNVRETPILECT